MSEVVLRHQPGLAHHVQQGQAWLAISADGENTAALSYAALELRLATERLATHYWATLLDRRPQEQDLRDIRSFKAVQRRIYELAGHQKQIDAHYEFMRIVLQALKIDMSLETPRIGELHKYWGKCSEYCHIAWPLSCSIEAGRREAFSALCAIADSLQVQVFSLGWPVLRDVAFAELRNRYVAGEVTEEDVLAHVRRCGVWARAEFTDGRPSRVVGEPVPPDEPGSDE